MRSGKYPKITEGSKVDLFFKEFDKETRGYPIMRHLRVTDYNEDTSVAFELVPSWKDDTIRLGAIIAFKKNAGNGTRALKWLCKLADKYEVKIVGQVERINKDGLNSEQLKKWYRKNGFKVKGRQIERNCLK